MWRQSSEAIIYVLSTKSVVMSEFNSFLKLGTDHLTSSGGGGGGGGGYVFFLKKYSDSQCC